MVRWWGRWEWGKLVEVEEKGKGKKEVKGGLEGNG